MSYFGCEPLMARRRILRQICLLALYGSRSKSANFVTKNYFAKGPMPNNARLIEKLEKLYLFEKKAEDMYAEFLNHIEDPKAREDISSVMKDEIKHEMMVQTLIKMVKNN